MRTQNFLKMCLCTRHFMLCSVLPENKSRKPKSQTQLRLTPSQECHKHKQSQSKSWHGTVWPLERNRTHAFSWAANKGKWGQHETQERWTKTSSAKQLGATSARLASTGKRFPCENCAVCAAQSMAERHSDLLLPPPTPAEQKQALQP